MGHATLGHEAAREKLEAHAGEQCQFGLWAGPAPVLVDDHIEVPSDAVLWVHGRLEVMTAELKPGHGPLYSVGGFCFCLPPLPGTITERACGLDFALTEGLTLRVAWPGRDGHPV